MILSAFGETFFIFALKLEKIRKMTKYLWLFILFFLLKDAEAFCKTYRYRVQFTDKKQTEYTLDRPEEYLSVRAIERRMRQGLAIDSTDLPVCLSYIRDVCGENERLLASSKWNNTALVLSTDSLFYQRIIGLPFVKGAKLVGVSSEKSHLRDKERKDIVVKKWDKTDSHYGQADEQIRMLHGDSLHEAGFCGEGMQIAVIDAGFYNVDVIKLFRGMHLLGTRDFVNPDSDIYEEYSHGLKVLSCMAVNKPRVMVGTAPEASYWLLRSEDNDTEQLVEEDYWAAAIEFADSAGVDVVNTSLGYYAFDDSSCNYSYSDLDGLTSLMTCSASRAADKGMIVVCSAGNEGNSLWKKITPPADAGNVLAVGAVDSTRKNATFSSVGNTADGRIKPDIMAMGVRSAVVDIDGRVINANGTSYASPILCGLVACLWQACPWLTAKQVMDTVRRSGDRADSPDNIFGYGIPDMWEAYRLGLELKD